MGIKKKITAIFAAAVMICVGSGVVGSVNLDEDTTQSYGVINAEAASDTLGKVTILDDYGASETAVKLHWKSVKGATGYRVYKYDSKTKKSTKIATIKDSSATSYRISGLKPGRAYQYRVRAYRIKDGKTTWGATSAVKYTATKPSATSFTSVSATQNAVTLKWKKVTSSGYRVYQLKSGKWKLVKTVKGGSETSCKITGLSAGKKYSFKIRPYRNDGGGTYKYGDFSAVKAVTTKKASTPVGQHGQLSVKGANIVDKNGKTFKIKGMSTHGIMWENYGDILSKDSLKVLRDDWKINTIRIAMYTEEWGGYTTGSSYAKQAKAKVEEGVKNATDLGLYVIIDWHILSDGDPRTHQSEAVKFFKEMANEYKNYNNVIYEICNEPNGSVTWNNGIKSYCQKVVTEIRKYDKDAIIICGTGTWSQDIDQVLGNRLSDKNCVYALHFYANTHTDWLRNRLKTCYNKGLPVLVSEFGTCDASGNGGYNETQTKKWLNLLDSLNVGYINWSAGCKSETASAFKSGTNLKKISSGTSRLTQSGKFMRAWFRAH